VPVTVTPAKAGVQLRGVAPAQAADVVTPAQAADVVTPAQAADVVTRRRPGSNLTLNLGPDLRPYDKQ
jgi:hypothetical protein